jgi:methenyltetrahydromethanopterin cyclohydrolase
MSFESMSSASDRVWSYCSYKSDIYRTIRPPRTCAQAERAREAGYYPSRSLQSSRDYDYDFYKIEPMLFAPAVALVTRVASGRTFRGGSLNDELLAQSFGAQRLAPATCRCALRS